MNGWHFCREDRTLDKGDGRKIVLGEKLCVDGGELELCKWGMHGAKRIIDALKHAPGPVLCWCEFGGEVLEDTDMFCAEWRTVLWWADLTEQLLEFARWCALEVIDMWDDAPDVVRKYINTGDEAIRLDAVDAAWNATVPGEAWNAANAARAAARNASVARDAAWSAGAAAWSASAAASEAGDWNTDWEAARNAQEQKLLEIAKTAGWKP